MNKINLTARRAALEKRINRLYSVGYKQMRELLVELNLEYLLTVKALERLAKLDKKTLEKVCKKIVNVLLDIATASGKEIESEKKQVFDLIHIGGKPPENPFTKLARIFNATAIYNDVYGALMSGILQGEAFNDLAERLKKISEKSLSDAIRISRSEITQAANAATLASGQGNNVFKRWSAVLDDRTRPEHAAMDGVTLPLEEPFTLPDGSKMMYPCDISFGAPLSQIINCRCEIELIKQG